LLAQNLNPMKKLVFLTLLLFALKSYAQDEVTLPVDSSGNTVYTEVINLDSTSKNDLYLRAKEWFAKTYKSSQSVIQMDDKEGGVISGKALTEFFCKFLGMPQ
jgi:hypothetical protein